MVKEKGVERLNAGGAGVGLGAGPGGVGGSGITGDIGTAPVGPELEDPPESPPPQAANAKPSASELARSVLMFRCPTSYILERAARTS